MNSAPREASTDAANFGGNGLAKLVRRALPHLQWLALRPRLILVLILLLCGSATVGAMRRTSTTFDEIVFMAGGARGFETGRFDLAPEHPPLMQYLYGLPIFLAGAQYPEEAADPPLSNLGYRYGYAQEFMWRAGNDPERVAFLARLMSALLALLLVGVTYAFARRVMGRGAALLAAALVAFLPDVLAHGGVAYNDLPLALFFVAALWGIDEAVRVPSARRGAVAGALVALAFGMKFSAVVLLPVVALLLGAEAAARGVQRGWLYGVGRASLAGLAAFYLSLVLVYGGDFPLSEFRYGLDYTFFHVNEGHGAPAFLLGARSTTGWWYFFPVAFFLKTPAALHVLMLLGLIGLAKRTRPAWRKLLGSPLRAPAIGAAVFFGALLTSNLNIGFRYALPALPLLCMLVAAGVGALWNASQNGARTTVAAVTAWYVVSSLSYYPHFLAYTSEYIPSRDQGYRALVDSSLDWGQGLLGLRDFMQNEGVEGVYLSYFGSASPEGYGINYVPLASFFPLRRQPLGEDEPKPSYAVISATNLLGVYLNGDPFASFREVEPDRVIGHTLFVYRLDD